MIRRSAKGRAVGSGSDLVLDARRPLGGESSNASGRSPARDYDQTIGEGWGCRIPHRIRDAFWAASRQMQAGEVPREIMIRRSAKGRAVGSRNLESRADFFRDGRRPVRH